MHLDVVIIQRKEKILKHKINIQLSKNTPPETVLALSVLLKAQNRKSNKTLYLSNEDIEKLNARYETLSNT